MTGPLLNLSAAISLLALFATVGTKATTVVPPTFEEMADRADSIFVGRASESHSEWKNIGTNRVIVTLVTFAIDDMLKGKKAPSITLQVLGGSLDGESLEVIGLPKFRIGEPVMLFVEKNGYQACPVVGFFHGKFNIHKDKISGRERVYMHDAKPLRDVREIGTGAGSELRSKPFEPLIAAGADAISLDDFKACVRSHLANVKTR